MKYKPEVSAGKAAAIGAALGAGVGAAGNPIIPALIGGVAAGVGQAVANLREARQGHSALNKTQFKTQAGYAKDL
jgi:hypothetical protein